MTLARLPAISGGEKHHHSHCNYHHENQPHQPGRDIRQNSLGPSRRKMCGGPNPGHMRQRPEIEAVAHAGERSASHPPQHPGPSKSRDVVGGGTPKPEGWHR